MNIAIVLAGGKGTRFSSISPKQFVEIESKPLIVHTLEKITKCKLIDEVIIVCLEDYVEEMKDIISAYSINKIANIVIGGSTRHESIQNGINYLINNNYDDNTKVIIHNANMPLVTTSNIIDCITNCKENTVVTTAAKCHGFFYGIDKNSKSLSIGPDRDSLLHAKVPEAMYLNVASYIYNNSMFNDKVYESYTAGMLGIILNLNVIPVICASTNMKITTKEDYELVQTYIKNEKIGE